MLVMLKNCFKSVKNFSLFFFTFIKFETYFFLLIQKSFIYVYKSKCFEQCFKCCLINLVVFCKQIQKIKKKMLVSSSVYFIYYLTKM